MVGKSLAMLTRRGAFRSRAVMEGSLVGCEMSHCMSPTKVERTHQGWLHRSIVREVGQRWPPTVKAARSRSGGSNDQDAHW